MLHRGSVTGWARWCAGQSWRWLCSRLSASVGQRCTCSITPSACLWILCSALLAGKASGCVVLTNHSQVSLYRGLHSLMPRKINTPLPLCSDLRVRFLDQELRFRYCGARKVSFGHFGLTQGQALVRLFQLYPTSMPCHSSRHVDNLQEMSCCIVTMRYGDYLNHIWFRSLL